MILQRGHAVASWCGCGLTVLVAFVARHPHDAAPSGVRCPWALGHLVAGYPPPPAEASLVGSEVTSSMRVWMNRILSSTGFGSTNG
jgi:hypothetical protein